jgi:Transposase, Mutator family
VSKDNIIKLIQPGNVEDQLTEILRHGARFLLAQAVEAEVADFLGKHADLKTADGHQRVVRHGHLPEREVMTGIGPVAVRQPRVRDREADAADPGRIRFSPSILPPYMRRSKSIETLLPILYLKGISTGDFSEALAALPGQGCCRVVGIRHWPPEGQLARRAHHVAEARSVGEALRLHRKRQAEPFRPCSSTAWVFRSGRWPAVGNALERLREPG